MIGRALACLGLPYTDVSVCLPDHCKSLELSISVAQCFDSRILFSLLVVLGQRKECQSKSFFPLFHVCLNSSTALPVQDVTSPAARGQGKRSSVQTHYCGY